METTTLPNHRARIKRRPGLRLRRKNDRGPRGDVEAAAIAVEAFPRDVEGLVGDVGEGGPAAAAGCAAAGAGGCPEGFAFFGGRGGEEDAAVVDFCGALVGYLVGFGGVGRGLAA